MLTNSALLIRFAVVIFLSSTLGELPEDAPTVFTQDLFPALEEVQLKDYTWPTTS